MKFLQHDKYALEKEDDTGQMYQLSGGFGNQQNINEDAFIRFHEQKQLQRQVCLDLQFYLSVQNNVNGISPQRILFQNQWSDENFDDYQMESNVFNFQDLKQSENYGLKKYSDAFYNGDLINGKRNGLGIMYYKKCRVYEGEWGNDMRHG